MIQYKMKKILVTVILSALVGVVSAQDFPQFTQYINMQGLINPAYNGTRGTYSGLMVYRHQWAGFDGAPRTLGFNAHGPVPGVERLSGGIVLISEGFGLNKQTDVSLASSYYIDLSRELKLSFGVQGGMNSYSFDFSELVTPDGGNDDVYNPSQLDHYLRPNFGVGAFLYSSNYFAGLSIPEMLYHTPEATTESFNTSFNFSSMHYFLYGGYVFDVDQDIKLKPTVLMKTIYGAPVELDLGIYGYYKDYGSVGLSYRTGSDVIFFTEVRVWEQLYVGYSFDYPVTKLNRITYGSHEISLRFDLANSPFSSGNISKGIRSIRHF